MGPVAEEEPEIVERVTEDESIELIDYLLVGGSRWNFEAGGRGCRPVSVRDTR